MSNEPYFRAARDFKTAPATEPSEEHDVADEDLEPAGDLLAHPLNPRWEYQWEDSLNPVGDPVIEPRLSTRILSELLYRLTGAEGSSPLIFVRGELGIGKTTLAVLLREELVAEATRWQEQSPALATALLRSAVLEAHDLETPDEFAERVNASGEQGRPTVALARPGTLESAAQSVLRAPDAIITMRTFEPTSVLFHECIDGIATSAGLEATQRVRLSALAGQMPPFLQTPFYFRQIADAVRGPGASDGEWTALELFRRSMESRAGSAVIDDLVSIALGRMSADDVEPLAGILDRRGFRHDGYRNLVLAVAVLNGDEAFSDLATAPNALPAVRILLNHVQQLWRGRRSLPDQNLISDLRDFVDREPDFDAIRYPVYIQGLIAATFRRLRDNGPAETLRRRCLDYVSNRSSTYQPGALSDSTWWDISDALSLVGDPRLRSAREAHYAPDSGFFTPVPKCSVTIGSAVVPARVDLAKPVLPYDRATVDIGPMWVAKFLVTNEMFRQFWDSRDRDRYFRGAGAQWLSEDPSLLAEIEAEFDVVAKRIFWKEIAEQQSVSVSAISSSTVSTVDVARLRALRQGRVSLWDPNKADDRFSADGSPVVGVTWWEADAFCAWWTDEVLDEAGFPAGSRAELLTDWEWEAVRRRYYERDDLPDEEELPRRDYAAHLRSTVNARRGERVNNVMRPLHVGLAPVPAGEGPYDLVGNVWEWTRSRVFGRIVASPGGGTEGFGETTWTHGDEHAERSPQHPARDGPDRPGDLSYRAVRGGSFFSRDEQAAWHPAYRLCDPPFFSFFDLGFRFAVYPPPESA